MAVRSGSGSVGTNRRERQVMRAEPHRESSTEA
jgi:hypothetical protein